MDRTFLSYYEEELAHVRDLAAEFAAMHPNVARNLALEAVPCPDPYVERLLEGVAFLAARTRLKVDGESTRYVASVLDALYPDLVAPAPAVSTAVLQPGPQVQTMAGGFTVPPGTRLVAGYREGLSTRATYTTAQAVDLWPIRLSGAEYLQDRGALAAAGLGTAAIGTAEAGIRMSLARTGPGALAELALDRLDLHLAGGARGGALFDAIFGSAAGVLARAAKGAFRPAGGPQMIGIADGEALLPRIRPSFEGYRLLREYFVMPERFHYLRLTGLGPAVRDCASGGLEIVLLLARPRPAIADIAARDLRLFATPVINLFEKECDAVELDPRSPAHILHADRTRPRDFEIYRLVRVEDAETTGDESVVTPVYGTEQDRGSGFVYATERRPRRAGEDELRRGQTRTSYPGDDVFVSVARRPGTPEARRIRRLDIRALCTNRDLPILDDTPRLTPEGGEPIGMIELLGPMRRPQPALTAELPKRQSGGEAAFDGLAWRLVAQLSLDHLSLAEGTDGAEPLRALLDLYADRGDPAHARHARAIRAVRARRVIERLGLPGPMCFGQGIEITLVVDDAVLAGASALLLPALLDRLFARHAGINGFVRSRTELLQRSEEVAWPMTPGRRALI